MSQMTFTEKWELLCTFLNLYADPNTHRGRLRLAMELSEDNFHELDLSVLLDALADEEECADLGVDFREPLGSEHGVISKPLVKSTSINEGGKEVFVVVSHRGECFPYLFTYDTQTGQSCLQNASFSAAAEARLEEIKRAPSEAELTARRVANDLIQRVMGGK